MIKIKCPDCSKLYPANLKHVCFAPKKTSVNLGPVDLFDRNAYQREYMRKRRLKAKVEKP